MNGPGGNQEVPQPARPLPLAARQKLQKIFEHGLRCVENGDHEYANKLFSQCVAQDPASLLYLQSFLANLKQKFGDPKKVSKFSALRVKGYRAAIDKSKNSGDWESAFTAGVAALSLNPWDPPTLMALSEACASFGSNDCRLYYLRWALEADPNLPEVNKMAAATLEQLGQFDQAIACWKRILQADPENEQAQQTVSRLSVEKTISKGNYDSASLSAVDPEGGQGAPSVAMLSATATEEGGTREELLRNQIETNPADVSGYIDLADLLFGENRLDEAEETLNHGMQASGGGDLSIRERLEEVQLRRVRHQLAVAQKRAEEEGTPEADALCKKMQAHADQVELEVFTARADREPKNARIKLELGIRLKRLGRFKEAITALQAARPLESRRAKVLLDLGECFHRIEQYKLALANYEESAGSPANHGDETHKLALYRAGVLATGLRELDLAERHLSELAKLDFGYKDVAQRLDKIAQLRKDV